MHCHFLSPTGTANLLCLNYSLPSLLFQTCSAQSHATSFNWLEHHFEMHTDTENMIFSSKNTLQNKLMSTN